MTGFTAHLETVGFWSSTLANWPVARAVMRSEGSAAREPQRIPSATMLAPGERRRAPETVALALTVSEEALHRSGRQARDVLAVFTSAHGDLPIIDDLCHTLVHTPLLTSPTRFVHSIHNAPAAYWSMLNGNTRCSSAVSGGAHSFAAGLLEALTICEVEQQPVLLVAYDTAAVGQLKRTTHCQGPLSLALVLSPQPGLSTQTTLHWQINHLPVEQTRPYSALASQHASNAMASALPLLEALARDMQVHLALPLSAHQTLEIDLISRPLLESAHAVHVDAPSTP